MRIPRIALPTAICVVLSVVVPSARAQYVFNRADFPIVYGPGVDLAVADFNGDGILDLVGLMGGMTNAPGTLSILLGKPDGTFSAHTDYDAGVDPVQVLVGDFNGDGKLDIATANQDLNGSSVSVFLGSGDGTFQAPITTSLGANAFGISAGDFNGDGKLDLIAAVVGGAIEVIPGNGDGTFGLPVTTQVVTNGTYYIGSPLAVGDFNGDSKLDVAVPLNPVSGVNGAVAVLPGNGDGSFKSPVIYPMQANSNIIAADVNHDGILDLVGDGSGISVLLGNGDGTFKPEIDSSQGTGYGDLVLGDFNGDGNLDAAVVAGVFSPQLWICLGDGKGNFGGSGPYALPTTVGPLRVGDFNGDGALDVATVGVSRVSVLLGNGDGSFGPTSHILGVPGPQSAAVADFNNDGNLDLAIAESVSYLGILLGNGDGTFTGASSVTLTAAGLEAVAADFNRDGKRDVAVLQSIGIQICLGNGDGTLTAGSQLPTLFGDDALVAADFNGDGKIDLLVGGSSSTARLFLGNGDGTFQPPLGRMNWPVGLSGQLIAADFDHDGKMDVAAAGNINNAGALQIFLGNGDGTFQPALTFPAELYPDGLVAADFNGDGKLDIAIATLDGVDVFLGNGDGTFQPYTAYPPVSSSINTNTIVAGDFNGDGKTDLAAFDEQNGILYMFMGNGDGTFSAPLGFVVMPRQLMVVSMPLAAGDFNRDGTDDIVFASWIWNSAPLASLRPRSLDFGEVPVGSSSAPQTVNLWNVGTAPLKLEGVTASGDFSLANNCPSSVPPRGQCSIGVTFTPTGGGARNSALVVTDNAPVHDLAVRLLGTGTGVSVIASPSDVAFGSALVGATTQSQTVTLSNTGSVSLSFSAISVTGPFAIVTSGTTCAVARAVAADSSCTVAVNFSPTAGGQATGSLSFSDNAAGSPQIVFLAGTGLDFTLAAASGSSTTATVTAGQTATYNLNLTATHGFNAAINLTCAGAPSLATCTVSPSAVTTSGSSAAPVTVTVATTAGSFSAPRGRLVPPGGGYPAHPWSAIGLLLAAALALGLTGRAYQSVPTRGADSTRMIFSISVIAATLINLALLASACGGGGGGGTGHNGGTPPGSYTLTLTGTASSGSTTLTNNIKLTLTVN